MNLIKLNCQNCDGKLDIDIDNMIAYCPYCGQKLLFDVEQMNTVFAEREKTKRAQEKTKREQEKTKRIELENDYKKKRKTRYQDRIYRLVNCPKLCGQYKTTPTVESIKI